MAHNGVHRGSEQCGIKEGGQSKPLEREANSIRVPAVSATCFSLVGVLSDGCLLPLLSALSALSAMYCLCKLLSEGLFCGGARATLSASAEDCPALHSW